MPVGANHKATFMQIATWIKNNLKNKTAKYCFILGSGASLESRIPMGRDLITQWREELLKEGKDYICDQMRTAGIDEAKYDKFFADGYKADSTDYFDFYDMRYVGQYDQGYQMIQKINKKAKTSFGYYALANIMEQGVIRIVITTNFDTLTEDTYFYVSGEHVLTVGHESLANFISSAENEGSAIVAKVHRDMLYAPMNRSEEMAALEKDWEEPLTEILHKYIPIVIGYAGCDHTLMSLLEKTDLKGLYWFEYDGPDKISDRVAKLLEKGKNRYVVNAKEMGFDQIMMSLGEPLNCPFDDKKISERIREKAEERIEILQSYKKSKDSSRIADKADDKTDDNPPKVISSPVSDVQAVDVDADDESDKYKGMSDSSLEEQDTILWNSGNYDESLRICNELVKRNPQDADCYNRRGTSLARMGRREEALADYNKAIELDSGVAKYYSNRGITLHKIGRYDEALADHNKAIELDSGDADYYFNRGDALYYMKRYDEALADFSKAIELDSSDASYYYNRGNTLFRMGCYEEALADHSKAIELDSSRADFYNSRGATLVRMGRYEEALADYNKAIELDSGVANYYNNRGNVLDDMKRYDEALADYNKAIELDSRDARYYYNRGYVLDDMKRYDEALADYNKAIELDSSDARFYSNRAITLRKLRRYDEALVDDNKAIELDSGVAKYYSNRAITLYRMGRYAEAVADKQKAHELDPENY